MEPALKQMRKSIQNEDVMYLRVVKNAIGIKGARIVILQIQRCV